MFFKLFLYFDGLLDAFDTACVEERLPVLSNGWRIGFATVARHATSMTTTIHPNPRE
jgi:hypothetical protein